MFFSLYTLVLKNMNFWLCHLATLVGVTESFSLPLCKVGRLVIIVIMRLKLLVVGDQCVGRTWLIHRFIHKEDVNFPVLATIGMAICEITIKGCDSNTYKLEIWELAGQERFFGFSGSFFRHASGFLLLFNVTDEQSFHNAIGKWIDGISSRAPADVPVILVGTKCELNEEREVSRDRIHMICDEMNLLYIEVSATEGINVDFAFKEILEEMIHFEQLKSNN